MEVKDVWLKLNLDGIKLYFKVKGYKKTTDSNWDDKAVAARSAFLFG